MAYLAPSCIRPLGEVDGARELVERMKQLDLRGHEKGSLARDLDLWDDAHG